MNKRYWVLVSLGWCSVALAQTAPVSVAPTEYVDETNQSHASRNDFQRAYPRNN